MPIRAQWGPVRVGGAIAVCTGALACVVTSFVSWVRSGTVDRSSYEILGLLDRLELTEGLTRPAVRWWPVMPLLMAAAVAALWWRRPLIAAASAAVGGGYAMVVGWMVASASTPGNLSVTAAPTIVTAAGAVCVLGALALVTPQRGAQRRDDVDRLSDAASTRRD